MPHTYFGLYNVPKARGVSLWTNPHAKSDDSYDERAKGKVRVKGKDQSVHSYKNSMTMMLRRFSSAKAKEKAKAKARPKVYALAVKAQVVPATR